MATGATFFFSSGFVYAEASVDEEKLQRFGEASTAGKVILSVLHGQALAYFNLAQVSVPQVLADMRHALQRGQIVVLDATQAHAPERVEQMTKKVLGIGLAKPVVAIARYADGSLNLHAADYRAHQGMAQNLLKQLTSTRRAKRNTVQAATSQGLPPPLVGKSIYLNFSHPELSCHLHSSIGPWSSWSSQIITSGRIDACKGQASYHAQIRLDYFSSNSRGAPSNFPAGKLLRIGQGYGNPAGTGWHLVNTLRNDYQSSTAGLFRTLYTYWFGPYVDNYGVSISLDNAEGVSLIEHEPKNTQRGLDVDVLRGDMLQRSGTASVTLSKTPSVGVSDTSTTIQTANTTLKYKLNEYEIINRSRGNLFDLRWNYALGREMYNPDAEVMAGSAYPIKAQLFSGVSYANFVPGFLTTYHAPFDKKGVSTFSLVSSALVTAALTYAKWDTLERQASQVPLSFTDQFTVDWDSLDFLPDQPNMLKAYRHDRLYCLTRNEDKVYGQRCDGAKKQRWMHNHLHQFISAENTGLCLTGKRNGAVTAEPCNQSGFQEWRWGGTQQDRLVNEATRKQLAVGGEHTAAVAMIPTMKDLSDCGDDATGVCSWRAYESL